MLVPNSGAAGRRLCVTFQSSVFCGVPADLIRNAPKCSNRKFWDELKLSSRRAGACTPAEMFEVCLDVLEQATATCVIDGQHCCVQATDSWHHSS